MGILRKIKIHHMLYDIAGIYLALFLAYFFRFGQLTLERIDSEFFYAAHLMAGVFLIFFIAFRFYKTLWYYAGSKDYINGVLANIAAGFVFLALQVVFRWVFFPIAILSIFLATVMTIGGRLIFRLFKEWRTAKLQSKGALKRAFVIGDPGEGEEFLMNLKTLRNEMIIPRGIYTKNNNYRGKSFMGMKIRSLEDMDVDIETSGEKGPELILIMDQRLGSETLEHIYKKAREEKLSVKRMKTKEELDGEISGEILEDVSVEEIFGAKEKTDVENREDLTAFYQGKTVMITGAAGKMGRVLTDHLVKLPVKGIYLLDQNEGTLNERMEELQDITNPKIQPVVANVKEEGPIKRIIADCKPDIIFHSAFLNLKNISENHPEEVLRTNLLGTYHIVEAADKAGCSHTLMLSVDRAEDPEDFVALTKKLAEMLIQSKNHRSDKTFTAFRIPELHKNARRTLNDLKEELRREGKMVIGNKEETVTLSTIGDAVSKALELLTMESIEGVYTMDPGEKAKTITMAEYLLTRFNEKGKSGELVLSQPPTPFEEIRTLNLDKVNKTPLQNLYSIREQFDDFEGLKARINALKTPLEKGTAETNEYYLKELIKEFTPDYRGYAFDGGRFHSMLPIDEGKTEGKIWLSSPHMGGMERHFVEEAFDTNWIAPIGPNVNEFEKEVAEYVGVKAAAAMTSGTAAIHIALRLLGVEQGDEVFCSSLTFSGSANPIIYEKAKPVFIDSEKESWNMSPLALEKALKAGKKKGKLPKALIVVNLYGQSANFDEIITLCRAYKVPIIEDAAESLGATYKGRQTGTFGDFGVFSFNGNKIITTSGGGMLVSNDVEKINKAKFLITQARDPARHYQHSELGFNYRMSNVVAGIGRGQLRVLDLRVEQKRKIYEFYRDNLAEIQDIQMMPIAEFGTPNYWLSTMTLRPESKVRPIDIMVTLEKENIESRPVWKPMHLQPFFKDGTFFNHRVEGRSVAKELFDEGVCLPSDTNMSQKDLENIVKIIKRCWE